MGLKEITKADEWESQVANSALPVFVDFWAEWCGPCKMVGPVVEELASEYDGKVDFVKVNVDKAGELASKFQVFSIPTLILFNKGKILEQHVGASSKDAYKKMLDKALENA